MGRCHAAAFVGTAAAGFGAPLAVIHLVVCALRGAGFADLRTDLTDRVHEAGTAAHERGGGPTNLRAIQIERDAAGHVGNVLLVQAGFGAVLALLGAAGAGVNTAGVFLVAHGVYLLLQL